MESDSIKEIGKGLKKTGQLLKTKKVQNILLIVLLIGIIFLGAQIRIQNLNLLKDQTTGEKIPLALDPYYFLRVAETIVENNGSLPEYDALRKPFEVGWHPEILPRVLIGMQKVSNLFGDFTLQEIDLIYPVVFFILSLIVFFLLISKLTKSKIIALISSLFLSIAPAFLYRTMAGFSDHEAIGMFSFFLLLLAFSVSLRYLENNFDKTNKKNSKKKVLYGILIGLLIALSITSWGGLSKFAFMIIPLSVLIFWFVKRKETDSLRKLKYIPLYYISTILSAIIFTPLISGHSSLGVITKYMLSSTGLISVFVLGFLIIDYLVIYLKNKEIIKIKKKYEIISSISVLVILGLILLIVSGELSLIGGIFDKILNPFGSGRIGETVAENKSPTIQNWINQTGKILFWIFIFGIMFVGREISRKISKLKKRKNTFFGLWIVMILGIIFSSHSIFGNADFLKKFIYFGSVIAFLIYSVWLYWKEKESFKINPELILIFSWMIFMLIGVRGAVRLFFVIIPLVCFMAGIVPVKLFEIARKNKDELIKTLAWIFLIAVVIGLVISAMNFYPASMQQAKNTGPSANYQWQNSMKWVRENTSENSVFLHWWDYGYWVESLGERATLADGGHFEGGRRDHMIGRYVLTTPKPETALSFMKSNNATHLLIDPTDIGKYGAYSRIGSGEEMKDRLSYITSFNLDPKQTRETQNETIKIYVGGFGLDEDLIYEKDGKEILLPRSKAALGGIILKTTKSDSEKIEFKQPEGVFAYGDQQYRIPIRYLYYQGQIIDFDSGINSTLRIVPSISQSQTGINLEPLGSGLYLSRKVSQSLVAQLYLMNDPFDKYSALKLKHKQPDSIIQSLKIQGLPLNDDFVNFRGLRGPIKIWEIEEMPENIVTHEELTERLPYGDSWKYGMLDELKFKE